MVTKNDFVKRIVAASDDVLTQKEVNTCLAAMDTVLTDIIKSEDSVKLCNVVTLSGEMKEAHTARNPATGGTIDVPAKIAPKAKFSSTLKKAINE